MAETLGYPVVMKVCSPDALHKSEAGGVMVGLKNREAVSRAFEQIRKNLFVYKEDAAFMGVRVMKQAGEGQDMFIGGLQDPSFGPVVLFGAGGIYMEVFKDVASVLCPASPEEIGEKLAKLKSHAILKGARGREALDTQGYVDAIVRVTHLMARFAEIKELDINPIRLQSGGTRVTALDARLKIEP